MPIITFEQVLIFFLIVSVILILLCGRALWTTRHERADIRKWKKQQKNSDQSLTFHDSFDWKNFKIK